MTQCLSQVWNNCRHYKIAVNRYVPRWARELQLKSSIEPQISQLWSSDTVVIQVTLFLNELNSCHPNVWIKCSSWCQKEIVVQPVHVGINLKEWELWFFQIQSQTTFSSIVLPINTIVFFTAKQQIIYAPHKHDTWPRHDNNHILHATYHKCTSENISTYTTSPTTHAITTAAIHILFYVPCLWFWFAKF